MQNSSNPFMRWLALRKRKPAYQFIADEKEKPVCATIPLSPSSQNRF